MEQELGRYIFPLGFAEDSERAQFNEKRGKAFLDDQVAIGLLVQSLFSHFPG